MEQTVIDWAATGSMLGGIGAILAACGTVFIIYYTRAYVHINAQLLALNRDSLIALRESVQTNRDMVDVMRHQVAIAGSEVEARIEQEHEPFRNLLIRMIEGCERVRDVDAIEGFRGGNLNLRPDNSWYLPRDYHEKLEAARNLDIELYKLLYDVYQSEHGELPRMQWSMNNVQKLVRDLYTDVPPQAYQAAADLKGRAQEAIDALQRIRAHVDARESRLKAVVRGTGGSHP